LVTYRRDQGLGEYHDHPIFGGQHSPGGVLALYSPLFGSLPEDAPPNTLQTGQVLQTGGGTLDEGVADFLSRGERPLVFTLGSASSYTARAFFRHSVRIAQRLRMRALLLVGRPENLDGLPQDETVLAAVKAPYQDVFPHARAVVHQGGIGTIALALTSGAPMLLVPFAHDQPDNSARAARAGVAKVIPAWRFGPSAARTVRTLCEDGAMRLRVAEAGAAMRAERGADRAASAIVAAAQEGRRAGRTAPSTTVTHHLTQSA
ncbi:MAG: nucleotide disphospho-sugar-binding domain-containing protein, partial [Pseudomonadota bacterium]